MSMNDELRQLYTSWKAGLERGNLNGNQLSPPALICVTPTYERASERVLIVGQEDRGNQWSQEGLHDPAYRYPATQWPYEPILSWADFLSVENSVQALMHANELFAFARYQPGNVNSAYWSAFRWFTDEGVRGAATNLDRTSFEGGPIHKGPASLRPFLRDQEGDLLAREISVLQPHVCIFLTGPERDYLIDEKWPNVERESISSNIPVRELCQLRHEDLPEHSYRTYHPNHLRRARKELYLDEIKRRLGR